LLKGGISLPEVEQCCGKNEASIHGTELNSLHPKHEWFFLNMVLGTICPQIPRSTVLLRNSINYYAFLLYAEQ
jgi:hypothetical protein